MNKNISNNIVPIYNNSNNIIITSVNNIAIPVLNVPVFNIPVFSNHIGYNISNNIRLFSRWVNVAGIWSLIKTGKYNCCRTCNTYERRNLGTICTDCKFCFASTTGVGDSKRLRVYAGSDFFKYGVMPGQNCGKHSLFFFLDHPELNFEFPTLPDSDIWDREILYPNDIRWIIHHDDGKYWNDKKNNLILCLDYEHTTYFEARNTADDLLEKFGLIKF